MQVIIDIIEMIGLIQKNINEYFVKAKSHTGIGMAFVLYCLQYVEIYS